MDLFSLFTAIFWQLSTGCGVEKLERLNHPVDNFLKLFKNTFSIGCDRFGLTPTVKVSKLKMLLGKAKADTISGLEPRMC